MVVVVVVAGACSPGPPAPADPQPSPRYEVASGELCTQAVADAIGAQLGLANVTHQGEPPVEDGEQWRTVCAVIDQWGDERLLTELGPAGPTSIFSLEVYAWRRRYVGMG